MNLLKRKWILFLFCVLWSPFSLAQPIRLAKLKTWLNTLAVTITEVEPYHDIYTNPLPGSIRACKGGAAPGQAPGAPMTVRNCYVGTVVLGPDTRLGAITDQERLEYLIHYIYQYPLVRPAGAPLPDVTWFTTKVNTINLYAGLIRCYMRKDQLALQDQRGLLGQALSTSGYSAQSQADIKTATAKSSLALHMSLGRELKLLDYLFLDAPLWSIMANNTMRCYIPPPVP